MCPEEYEAYVQELIGNLLPFRGLKIRRNERISGVRQPGQYEIDVAVEFFIADKLRFLLIVECKNWQKPVGRDVVQKLAQTRDAIAAHKAVVCSPVGFTKEAKEVAYAHGIALWVIAADRSDRRLERLDWDAPLCSASSESLFEEKLQRHIRKMLVELWGWYLDHAAAPSVWRLRSYDIFGQTPPSQHRVAGIHGEFRTCFQSSTVSEPPLADFLFDAILEAATVAEATRSELAQLRARCEDLIRAEELEERRRWALERAASGFGLTQTRGLVLNQLGIASGPLAITEINVPVVSWAVEIALLGLQSAGYVSRVAHEESGNNTDLYQITTLGATILGLMESPARHEDC